MGNLAGSGCLTPPWEILWTQMDTTLVLLLPTTDTVVTATIATVITAMATTLPTIPMATITEWQPVLIPVFSANLFIFSVKIWKSTRCVHRRGPSNLLEGIIIPVVVFGRLHKLMTILSMAIWLSQVAERQRNLSQRAGYHFIMWLVRSAPQRRRPLPNLQTSPRREIVQQLRQNHQLLLEVRALFCLPGGHLSHSFMYQLL